MPTPQQIAAAARAAEQARVARVMERMRANRAALALGDDIPRPNPSAAALPELRQAARGYDGTRAAIPMPPADVPSLPSVPADSVAAIVRKVSQEGVDALTPDEAILFDDLVAGRVRVEDSSLTTVAREAVEDAEGDLPPATGAADQIDNVESSAINLDTPTQAGNPNLRVGRKKKQSPAEAAANEVRQLTTESAEALSPRQVKRTLANVKNANREAVLKALGPDGEERLARLEQIAGADPNAAARSSIERAAQAREASGTPRTPRQSVMAGMEPNEFGVTPGLPGLIERFNALPDAVRTDVVRRLQANPNAASLFEAGGGVDSISPNRLAELLRPVNDVDDVLMQADQARAIGNTEAADAALALAREAPADARRPALAAFSRRRAIEAALRESLPAADPTPQVMASPGQPALRGQGAQAPEFATDDPSVALPDAVDDAAARARERALERENRAPGGGLTEQERLDAAGAASLRELPLALKGRDGRPSPLETRSRGKQGVESNDVRAIQKEIRREELIAEQRAYAAAAADAEAAGDVAALDAANAELDRIKTEMRSLGRPFRGGRKAMSDSRLNTPGQQETLDELGVTAVGFRPGPELNLNRSSDSLSAADRAALQEEAVRAFGETEMLDMLPEEGQLDDVAALGEGGKRGRLGGARPASRWMDALQRMYGNVNLLDIFEGDALAAAEDTLSRMRIFKPGTANYEMARDGLAKVIEQRYSGQRTPDAVLEPRPERAPFQRRFQRDVPPADPVATSQDTASVPQELGAQFVPYPPGVRPNAAGTPSPAPTPSEYKSALRKLLETVQSESYVRPGMSDTLVDAQGNPVEIDTSGIPVARRPSKPRTQRDFSQPETVLSDSERALLEGQNFPDADVVDDLPPAQASNLEASAVELGTDLPPAAGKKGTGRGGKAKATTETAKPAPAAGGDLPPAAGRKLTTKEIQEQAEQVFREEYQQAIDGGMTPAKARAAANKARKKAVDDLTAANKDLPDAGSAPAKTAPQAAADSGTAKPQPADQPAAASTPAADAGDLPEATGSGVGAAAARRRQQAQRAAQNAPEADDLDAATGTKKPKKGGDKSKPADTEPPKGKDADGAGGKKDAQPEGRIRRLLKNKKLWLAGAGLVGLGLAGKVWDYLDDSENAPIDIPGGGGGGGADGQGGGRDINLPVPPGGVPNPEPMSLDDKVTATLERIRMNRAMGLRGRGTQTLQNF